MLDAVDDAIAEFAAGRPVMVVDDEDRENEGDLIVAAALVTPEVMAFIIRYTGGVVCVPMEGPDLDRLELPPMCADNQDPKGTAFTVSTDALGCSTGISAADRALTVRVLADQGTTPEQLMRPGHVYPLRCVEGGLLARNGHTEAGVALARLAGLAPAAAISEIVNDDGTMQRLPQLRPFADEHGLKLISIEQLIAYQEKLLVSSVPGITG
jgi:3,4-dihydroxy 2-butanone 4-phosphate synthase / GTP cyclohydrolase II